MPAETLHRRRRRSRPPGTGHGRASTSLLVGVLALVAAAACSGAPAGTSLTTTGAVSAAPTSSTPSPTTPPAPASSAPASSAPALAPVPAGTVLAVKIDNTSGSRPRLGVDEAAVVYVEPVEGGLTRLLAVFTTAAGPLPPEVGPIRSARESDPAILAPWGRVAFAYSGGSAYTRAIVNAADLATVSYDASIQGYRRAGDRRAPYNVIGSVPVLLARAGTGPTAGDPGFRFGPTSPGGGSGAVVSTRWPAASMSLGWDSGTGRYLVTTDGVPDVDADGARHSAATVVVQEVATHLSQNRDVNGAQTPVVDVVGQGAVTVLRDGRAWRGQWSRPAAGAPTTFTADGGPVAMAAPVWVLLVPAGQAVEVR